MLSQEQVDQLLAQERNRSQTNDSSDDEHSDNITNANEEEDDDSTDSVLAREAAELAYEVRTCRTRFPRNSNCLFTFRDSQARPMGTQSVFKKLEDFAKFPFWPKVFLQGDIDSIYSHSRHLSDLLRSFGSFSIFSIKANIDPNRKAYSSRFFVDCTGLTKNIFIGSNKAKRVPLQWFPNIEIAKLYLPGIHRPASIYFHCLKVNYIKKNQRFSKIDVAVINSSLNLARVLGISKFKTNLGIQSSFHDFYPIEANFGEESKKTQINETNDFPRESALKFAECFEDALNKIANGDDEIGNFHEFDFHRVRSNETVEFSRADFVNAAKELRDGCLITASMAGVKQYFHHSEFQTFLERNQDYLDQYQDEFDNNKQQLVEIVNNYISETHQGEGPPTLLPADGGNLTINKLKKIPYSLIEDIFPSFHDDIQREYESTVNSILDKLHLHLFKMFKMHEDDAGVAEPRPNDIYFDIGVEIRFQMDMSCLINLDESDTELKRVAGYLW